MALRELAVGPAAYQHTCTVASGETWDPTTATAAELQWYSVPRGVSGTWSATISGASASGLVLTHVLQDGDLPVGSAGEIRILPVITLPSGSITCGAVSLRVKGRYDP